MNTYSFRTDGHECWLGICPAAGVVILNAISFAEQGLVRVSAEDAIGSAHAGMHNCPRTHLGGKAQPARAEAVNKT